MNEKHAREARTINRAAGTLVKKGTMLTVEREGAQVQVPGRYKLPRAVKRAFDLKTHRAKGKFTKLWRSGVAHSLKTKGVLPKGEDPTANRKSVRKNIPSRHVRKSIRNWTDV
jgi:hypothetical protein